VVSIDDEVAAKLLAETGNTLEVVQAAVDAELSGVSKNAKDTSHAQSENSAGEAKTFDRAKRPGELASGPLELGGRIDLETQRAAGTNILGRLQVGDTPSRQTIVLGAHFDHLGRGEGAGSLASGSDVGGIHPGADDNASGTALLIEIAEWLVSRKRAGLDLGERDFIFAAWSGEELGLLGSHAWVEEHVNPHSDEEGPVAYLNFDMVGRLRENLVVQGLGSSPAWAELLERAAAPLALSISPQQDSYVPTDATSFYTQGVPVLNAFTGAHSEYHTPRDTLEFLNFEGTAEIGELFARIAEALSRAPDVPAYQAQRSPASGLGRTGFRVFLGTVPDYAQTEVSGVRLSGVAPAGPAEEAGIRGGDIIVEVDGRTIENLYDYTYALEALRVGIAARIVVLRENQRVELEVVPGSRD
jgi:Zn-dependent M28 family amino/carboxypeptidase